MYIHAIPLTIDLARIIESNYHRSSTSKCNTMLFQIKDVRWYGLTAWQKN